MVRERPAPSHEPPELRLRRAQLDASEAAYRAYLATLDFRDCPYRCDEGLARTLCRYGQG